MTMLTLNQEKILKALKENNELTYNELVVITGIPYSGITSRVTELVKLGYNIQRLRDGSNTILRFDDDYGEESSYVRSQITPLERAKSVDDFHNIKGFIESIKDKSPSVKRKKKKVKTDKMGFLLLSDLHFGEIILDDDGEEIYNTSIANDRLEVLTFNVIDKLLDEGIEDVYIGLLGDVVDGDSIYRNHIFYVEKPAIEQIKDVTTALTKFINTLVDSGFYVTVGCVRGNHGITNYNNLEVDNWDNVVYDMLSLVFDKNDDVVIDHFTSDNAKITLLDKNIVLSHGRDMGSQIKTASGLRNFRGMCSRYRLVDGDMIVVGHLHEFGFEGDQGKFLVRNGGLPDASEYALKFNYYGEPSQTLMILNRGVKYPSITPIEVK